MRHQIRLDADHVYWHGEVRVPGFSEICAAMGVTKPNRFYTAQGRERGTAVHQWASFHAEGKTSTAAPDERIAPRVDQFKKFLEQSGWRTEGTEVSLYCPELDYACTEDLYGYLGSFSAVVDIKTGGKLKIAELQTAAQKIALAANGFRAQKRFGLYLKDSNYRFPEHTDGNDAIRWRAIVSGYHIMTPDERAIFAEDAESLLKMNWTLTKHRTITNARAARSFYI